MHSSLIHRDPIGIFSIGMSDSIHCTPKILVIPQLVSVSVSCILFIEKLLNLSRLLRVRSWLPDLKKALNKRFKWRFVLAGLIAMSIAALSWDMESLETSWIWHRYFYQSLITAVLHLIIQNQTLLYY